jgi:hypothetical protein
MSDSSILLVCLAGEAKSLSVPNYGGPTMPRFTKKPVEVDAHQWWKNGDHPDDKVGEQVPDPMGGTYEAVEGQVVRFFRRPEPHYAGDLIHQGCGYPWHAHGWIDTLEGGHQVCPGDWIITGVQGEHYPCKPGIFEQTYLPVLGSDSVNKLVSPSF